jgi:hypothetical protein
VTLTPFVFEADPQANVGHGALGPPGTEQEMRNINQPLLADDTAQPEAPANKCLKIVRGIVSIFIVFCCLYNLTISINHGSIKDWWGGPEVC